MCLYFKRVYKCDAIIYIITTHLSEKLTYIGGAVHVSYRYKISRVLYYP